MGICWYCYWGWSKPVAAIYKKALDALCGWEGPLHFGPSHLVWEDENFGSAEWCLAHFDEYKRDYTVAELTIVKQSLEDLAKLPLDIRCVEPEDYEGEHPELFPPPIDIEMVKESQYSGNATNTGYYQITAKIDYTNITVHPVSEDKRCIL